MSGGSSEQGQDGAYHGPTLVQVDCVRLEFGRGGRFIWVLFSGIRLGLDLDE